MLGFKPAVRTTLGKALWHPGAVPEYKLQRVCWQTEFSDRNSWGFMDAWFRKLKAADPTRSVIAPCGGSSSEGTSGSSAGWRYPGGVLILAVLLVVLATPVMGDRARGKEPQGQELSPEQVAAIESSIRRYTNEERQRRHLEPLQPSPALAFLARRQSEHMCRAKKLKHESKDFPKGWQLFAQRLKIVGVGGGGENIAFRTVTASPKQWAKEVVRGWMKSPGHRRNILRSEFRYIGIGVEPCKNRLAYATQVFSPFEGRAPNHARRK